MRPSVALASGAALGAAAAVWWTRRREAEEARAGRPPVGRRAASSAARTVVITGGCGNLGVKLATHLLGAGGWRVVLIEHPDFYAAERVPAGAEVVVSDLGDARGLWADALDGADALVHFSAVNPYPNASWGEAAASMTQTFNAMLGAAERGVRRVVFASSNHVMGGYKDEPTHGLVTPACAPRCGTRLRDPADAAKSGDAVAYACAKLAGEQLARSLASRHRATSFVALRIGWCQPGENLPNTLNPSGSPPQFQNKVDGEAGAAAGAAGAAAEADGGVDTRWFRTMWLSNRDFLSYFRGALSDDAAVAEGELLVLNAMSNNAGMRWDVSEAAAAIGVTPEDDAMAA